MPELPEVECFVRALNEGRNLGEGPGAFPPPAGARIVSLRCDYPPCLRPSPAALRRCVTGARIERIFRRGKQLAFALDRGYLLMHLRMSGRVVVLPRGSRRPAHAHASLALDSGYAIHLDDARKFGRLRYVEDFAEIDAELGVEPLSRDFSAARLSAILAGRKRALKGLLLDQTLIAGIGNIYADESLWRSRLHPLRSASSVTEEEAASLRKAIRACLREGIAKGGSAIDWVYPGGRFQEGFAAYGRPGLPCPRCGAALRRIAVGQRSSHFCPRCQRP